ncbi:hypothetical protein J2S19_000899 [Metabacillus malikii]|uniref:Uncharacterized protein n=2 Tax=Metabacillus malikii TaxID=1504265 RepID=A0ABT9ZBK5_9BACI|nr:hypothetical protein [Metabacillus malikii]
MTHSWYVDDDESLIKTKAQYIGLIDSHSIEVFIDSKPLAIQITEAQREKIESFTPNQQITISYYYNELTTQYILVSIQ